MDGPIEQPKGATLFDTTSRLAGEAAVKVVGHRRRRILELLAEGPKAIFECADALGVFDHQISGRFGKLERDGLIRKTGERRVKPDTKCQAEVYALADFKSQISNQRALATRPFEQQLDTLGYPRRIILDEGSFDRGEAFDGDLPGVSYTRDAGRGGVRLHFRVELVECGACGKPLKMVVSRDGGKEIKTYRCGTAGCRAVWRLRVARTPEGQEYLTLVMTTL